jgi:outer membrane protein OmpA-like peptidoglycan-associated protein
MGELMNIINILVAVLLALAPVAAVAIDYTNTDVKKQDFSGQNLRGSTFTNTNIMDSSFAGSDMQEAGFSNAEFSGGSLNSANLRGATCTNSTFANVDIRGADFSGANFTNCDFSSSIADSATRFDQAHLVNTDLPGSKSEANSHVSINSMSVNTNAQNTTVVSTGDSDEPMNIAVDTGGINIELNNPGMHIKVGQSGSGNVTRVVTPGTNIEVGSPAPREFKDEKRIVADLERPQSRVDLTVNFEFDSDKILAEGHKQVYAIAQALKNPALKGKSIRIEGHTDSKGTDAYNVDLSYRRAVSVMNELSQKYDVDTSKLTVKGFGESQPVATNDTDEGRALNRRVTLVNVERFVQ